MFCSKTIKDYEQQNPDEYENSAYEDINMLTAKQVVIVVIESYDERDRCARLECIM